MNNTEKRFFEAFFNTRKEKLYFNELKDLTNSSISSIQNTIQNLEKNNIVKKEKTKSNTYYKIIDLDEKALQFTKISLEKFNNLNYNVKIPLEDFLKNISHDIFTILLFGSTCEKRETQDSDIDLLIVLNRFENDDLQDLYDKYVRNKIKEIKAEVETTSIYPLNIFITNLEDFEKNKDTIIVQAKEKGFAICNQFVYYRKDEVKIFAGG